MYRGAITLITIVLLAITAASAQMRRTDGSTDGKRNVRSAEATPTPPVSPKDAASLDDGDVIKVATQLVSLPVRVMDRKGRFIGGLSKENFKIFENGIEQEIAMFSTENEPFTVTLVLDMSYSTKFKLAEIQSAAIAFIEQLRPQDRVMVVSFAQDVHVLCEPTSDRREIYRAIRSTKIATGTSLYEAVELVMNSNLRYIDGRKAIILFSDGVDTTSRRSNDMRNLHDAMELDSLVYTIRYDTFADVQSMKSGTIVERPKISIPTANGSPVPVMVPAIGTPSSQGTTPEEYAKAREYLDQLAMRTGGRLYEADTLLNLNEAYSGIASELREFYSVGYYPSEEREPGKTSSVKIKVDRTGLVVRARENIIRRKSPRDK